MTYRFNVVLLLATLLITNPLESYAKPNPKVWIKVIKSARKLELWQGGAVSHSFKVCLGFEPTGHKTTQGDGRTPEGDYTLNFRNPQSQFYKSFQVSYPNDTDRAQAKKRRVSPGGDIMVHGCGSKDLAQAQSEGQDWTLGCIALTDSEIDTLWKYVPVGTPITILP